MKRERLLPLLTILTIGALVAGSLMCVIGTVVAGKRMGGSSTSATVEPLRATSRATGTPMPTSLPGESTFSVTGTPSAEAQSPPSSTTSTPTPAATSPSQPSPTASHTFAPTTISTRAVAPPTVSPTSAPEPSASSPINTPEPPDPSPAPAGTPTPTPLVVTPRGPASVRGHLVRDGTPVETGVTVKLEDQAYAIIATTTTDAQGTYAFEGVTTSGTGLDVLFAQEWNEQYDVGEVASWAWLGPFTIPRGMAVELPDFEIGLLGFEQVDPPSGAFFSAADISAQAPLVFEWNPYPQATAYWVDLTKGDDLNRVWQSALVETTSLDFYGTLGNGDHITADTYYWGIGARKNLGDYHLTVYGYLPTLIITP